MLNIFMNNVLLNINCLSIVFVNDYHHGQHIDDNADDNDITAATAVMINHNNNHDDYRSLDHNEEDIEDNEESSSSSSSSLYRMPKYLNKRCDFEAIPARGCHLRESYCSLHTCICKPDYPINIGDRLCLARYKRIGELCQYHQECQQGMLCTSLYINHVHNATKMCHCKSGYVYSYVQKQCMKGLKGASCRKDQDCIDQEHMFCSLVVCECKYGYQWYPAAESCLKRSKHGERCDQSINCKVHDEFSECDTYTKRCVCGEFLSRKYTLDEVTRRCISCPINRYNHSSNTCLPEKTTVEYSLLDRSTQQRNSHRYSNIALSMAPFVLFALIGFAYRYVHPYRMMPDGPDCEPSESNGAPGASAIAAFDEMQSPCSSNNTTAIAATGNSHFCLPIAVVDVFENGPSGAVGVGETYHQHQLHHHASTDTSTTCLLPSLLSPACHPDPPPPYDLASQDLPPSYDEAIAEDDHNNNTNNPINQSNQPTHSNTNIDIQR